MEPRIQGLNTHLVHTGELEDPLYHGAVSPLYLSTSYAFDEVDMKRYPRNFNTPNQEALGHKIAALEKKEAALIFGSGMAAVSTAIMGLVSSGDHIVFQDDLYGGTRNLALADLRRFGIEFSMAKGLELKDFESEIRPNTKLIYVETPSNPLLKIIDLDMIGRLAKKHGIISMIDNTFASPVNQVPDEFGIDVVIHSATKYMGGHSDISAGAIATSNELIAPIWSMAKSLGGNLSEMTVWLLERSIKTMGLRVHRQNENALAMAHFLSAHHAIDRVYYPGLVDHPGHEIAKQQMKGFGGMMSFELRSGLDARFFQQQLKLIKPSMSLAGVESTVLSPTMTSHHSLTLEERKNQGISEGLIRFSVGIEEVSDLQRDIEQALAKTENHG